MDIGKHIWQILREKQISVKEFAEATNTERTTMYRILHRKSIDISVLEHYSRDGNTSTAYYRQHKIPSF